MTTYGSSNDPVRTPLLLHTGKFDLSFLAFPFKQNGKGSVKSCGSDP